MGKKQQKKTTVLKGAYYKGGKIKVNPDPTSTTRVPWNRLTLIIDGLQEASDLTFASVHAAIQTQLGLTPANFEMKVEKVRAWGPIVPTDNNQTVIAVGDILDDEDNGIWEPLAIIADSGTIARRAAVGYIWPLAHRGNVIVTSEVNNIKLLETENVTLIHLEVLWKPRFVGSRSAERTTWFPNQS